jgi:hypothetical protein
MPNAAETLKAGVVAAISVLDSTLDFETPLLRAANLITECLLSENKILACGNGGSAADAADFTTEFACKFAAIAGPIRLWISGKEAAYWAPLETITALKRFSPAKW